MNCAEFNVGLTSVFVSLGQTIATSAGQQYTFAGWLQNGVGSSLGNYRSSVDGPGNGFIQSCAVGSPCQFSHTFTAAGASSVFALGISRLAPPAGVVYQQGSVRFDQVSVTPVSTVPEPSTYALLGTGLCALGGIAARRRRV